MLLVQLGDVEHGGKICVSQGFPALFGADGDTGLGGQADDAGIGNTERLHDLGGKVKVAGVVQNVELAAGVFHGDDGGFDGILTLLFFFIEVGNGGAVGALAETGDGLGQEEHAFTQGGLAVAAVTQKSNIADVLRSVHSFENLLSEQSERDCAANRSLPQLVSLYTMRNKIAITILKKSKEIP